MKKYFDPNKKLPFLEDLLFDYSYDDDTKLIIRTSIKPSAIILGVLILLVITVAL